jgi:hypothetical protein
MGPGTELEGFTIYIRGTDLTDVVDRKLFFYIWGWCRYRDVFDDTPERLTEFCFQVIPSGNPAKPVSDTNIVQCSWPWFERHNNAT